MTTDTKHAQLVWDRGSACTAQATSGSSITIGPAGEWTPEQLLVAAVESSLMAAFLRLADAAGLGVLGYVSAADATLEHDPLVQPSLVVRPCVVVAHERDREAAHELLHQALGISPIVRALGDTVRSAGEVIVVAA